MVLVIEGCSCCIPGLDEFDTCWDFGSDCAFSFCSLDFGRPGKGLLQWHL